MRVHFERVVAGREPRDDDAGVAFPALVRDDPARLLVSHDDIDCAEEEVRIELDIDSGLAVFCLERQGILVDELLQACLLGSLLPGLPLEVDDIDASRRVEQLRLALQLLSNVQLRHKHGASGRWDGSMSGLNLSGVLKCHHSHLKLHGLARDLQQAGV